MDSAPCMVAVRSHGARTPVTTPAGQRARPRDGRAAARAPDRGPGQQHHGRGPRYDELHAGVGDLLSCGQRRASAAADQGGAAAERRGATSQGCCAAPRDSFPCAPRREQKPRPAHAAAPPAASQVDAFGIGAPSHEDLEKFPYVEARLRAIRVAAPHRGACSEGGRPAARRSPCAAPSPVARRPVHPPSPPGRAARGAPPKPSRLDDEPRLRRGRQPGGLVYPQGQHRVH